MQATATIQAPPTSQEYEQLLTRCDLFRKLLREAHKDNKELRETLIAFGMPVPRVTHLI